ncbi:MAG: hypothetical protein ACQEQF_07225 [Bacillota bacterium]
MKKIVVITIILTFFSLTAFAHKPIDTSKPATRNDPIVIKDHQISWVAYNKLTDIDDVDYYKLESVKQGEEIYLSMLVPKIERLEDFDPVIALIGPGLPNDLSNFSEEEIKEILDIYDNEGVVIKLNDKNNKTFFEPFTQTTYWERQELRIIAPASGDYYVAVFDEEIADKYVLSIGEKEEWGIRDIIKMPMIWWNVRMFMEKKWSTYLITAVVILVLILIIKSIISKIFIK